MHIFVVTGYIWKEFFILGAVMFKLSVCWVPGELRPLLGRQKVYVSFGCIYGNYLLLIPHLSAVFLREGFFLQKSINHIFLQRHENVSKSIMKFSSARLEKSNWKSPVKKNWQAYNNCIFYRCYYLLFPPSHIRQAKKEDWKEIHTIIIGAL